LDESWDGRQPTGLRLYTCDTCLSEALSLYFESFRGRCLLLEPSERSNAYYGYTASDEDMKIAQPDDKPEKTRSILNSFLDTLSGTCHHCATEPAAFAWLPATVFENKWWSVSLSEIRDNGTVAEPFCGSCAAISIVKSLQTLDRQIDQFNTPNAETVLMFSGEY